MTSKPLGDSRFCPHDNEYLQAGIEMLKIINSILKEDVHSTSISNLRRGIRENIQKLNDVLNLTLSKQHKGSLRSGNIIG